MNILLKKDWDVPINAPIEVEQRGYFVGRKAELDLLANEILRKTSGAILVSGYRGVGKTSLAYKALWEVKSNDKNNIIVLLNASQLEAELDEKNQLEAELGEKNQKSRPRAIIENLIRRLYSVTKEREDLGDKIKPKIDRLYRKTVATEFRLRETYQQKIQDSLKIEEEDIKEIWASEKNIRNVIFFGSWVIASVLLFGNIFTNTAINNGLALLLAFPVPFFVNIAIKHKLIKKHYKEISQNIDELYEFDDTIGNLEFDLEDIHRDIKQKDKKLIYVIDELDKLDSAQVIEVLKFFKNLFTISDAIFIFIGNEDIFKIGLDISEEEKKQGIYRSKAYTYFTSRYFLSRPLWDDLFSFLKEIIKQKDIDEKKFEVLGRALAFDARNDFFDLKKFIRDKITNFSDDDNPIIKIDKLIDEDIQKARFQKSITALFEDKYMLSNPSRWEENELILRTLFDHAHKIYSSYSGVQFNDLSEDKIEASASRDYNNFLWRNGAFNLLNESLQNIKGVQIPMRNYTYIGHIPNNPPDYYSESTEIENMFAVTFRDYVSYIIALNNVFRRAQGENEISEENFWTDPTKYVQQINSWGFDALNIFNSNNSIYKNITNKEFSSFKREDIEQRIGQITNHIKLMIQSLPNIVSQIVISLNQNLNLQSQKLQGNTSLFGGSANEVRNSLTNYNPDVIFNPDLSRQVLLIFNQLNTLLSIKKHIRDNAKTHRIGCFISELVSDRIKGLYLVNTKSPSELRRSLIGLIKNINVFFTK